jgi:predicted chitinase
MNLNINLNGGGAFQSPFVGGAGCAGGRGFPMGSQQQMMQSVFGMMAMTMMAMMQQMMGGGIGQGSFPMQMCPGRFGMPGGGGLPMGGGSPLGNFLGGGGMGMGGFPGGMGMGGFPGGMSMGGFPGGMGMGGFPGGMGMGMGPGAMGPIPGGPAGRIGNIDVNRLVSVLPRNLQQSARQHFPFIVQEAMQQGVQNKAQLAYILATATHESNAGKNMEEFASGRAYEGRRSLGNVRAGDGVRFKGRGYVQLTGRRNYTDWSRRLGVDLVSNPRLVQNPRVAAKILVGGMMKGTFTGKGLGSYINGSRTDLHGARRTVNGTDRAGHIAGIAQRLMAAM